MRGKSSHLEEKCSVGSRDVVRNKGRKKAVGINLVYYMGGIVQYDGRNAENSAKIPWI